MSGRPQLHFVKGHGTENDFLLLPDPDGELVLTPSLVRWLAGRRVGLGADGVIRVVPTARARESHVRALADKAAWFMDYWNADGGTAEMCGNGARVFAAYLRRSGWQTDDQLVIATRSGVKRIRWEGELIAVDLGAWRIPDDGRAPGGDTGTRVTLDGRQTWTGVHVDLGNPHIVVDLPPEISLDTLSLNGQPRLDPVPDHGSNVEFSRLVGPRHLRMRVYERGVGETRSCGTGAAAAAVVAMTRTASPPGAQWPQDSWRVDVPGGTLWVRALPHQHVELLGPASLVAEGTVYPPAVPS